MRHRKHTAKLGRTSAHRNAMLANLVCSLIQHKRVTTTLSKAKAARPVAEKMVTLGKTGTIHAKRLAAAHLQYKSRRMLKSKEEITEARKQDVIRILFDEIAPVFQNRPGGYTRIVKLNERNGDAAQLAILEWVETTTPAELAPAKKETTAQPAPASQPSPEPAPAAAATAPATVAPAAQSPAPETKPTELKSDKPAEPNA